MQASIFYGGRMKPGNLRLPVDFGEALGDLLKVKPPPPPKPKRQKRKRVTRTTRKKA